MLQGGSAIMFNGLDTRQLKVSGGDSRTAAFDFKSVLSEKRSTAFDSDKDRSISRKDEKLNKHEMTRKEKPLVNKKRESQDVKKTDSKEKTKTDESKESKEIRAAKKLLEKLGMSVDEIDQMLGLMPEEMISELTALMNMIPQLSGSVSKEGEMLEGLSSLVGSISNLLDELSQLDNISSNLLSTIQSLESKLDMAQLNLESMEIEEFTEILKEVQSLTSEGTETSVEKGNSEIEILDVEVTSVKDETSSTDVKNQDVSKVETDQTSGEQSAEGSATDAESSENGTGNSYSSTVVASNTELSPSQVDQQFTDMLKVENTVIKNTQPMELASGRVRLAQNVMDQVMQGAKLQLNPMENGQQVILRLRPEELGNVNLKLSVEKGILMAEFSVESQIVKETLESNMSDLKQALSEKGYNIEGMEVSVDQEQTEQQSENQFFNQSKQRKYFFGLEEDLPDFESINKSLAGLQSSFEYFG